MEIKFNLTIDEVKAIISSMAMLPFNQVHGLVGKIREQAIPQVQAAEAAAKAEADAANETEGGDVA
jgi:hypothetical protein